MPKNIIFFPHHFLLLYHHPSSSMDAPSAIPVCYCGEPAAMKTSWSDENPGRRFFGCPRYRRFSNGHCRFFLWFDAPLTGRSKAVIVGLLRKVKKDEVAKRKERIGWLIVVICLLVVLGFK